MFEQASLPTSNWSRRRFLASGLGFAAGLLVPGYGAAASDPLASGVVVRPSRKWLDMIGRHGDQCDSAHPGETQWRKLLQLLRELPAPQRMAAVNRLVNARPYREDGENYGVSDHWATPREFLVRGGDCEDFAATKYLALLESGVHESGLRFVVLKPRAKSQMHAVVAVLCSGSWYVLDNLRADPIPVQQNKNFTPVYSISGDSRWIHRASLRSSRV